MSLSSGSFLWGRKACEPPMGTLRGNSVASPHSLPTAELSLWPGWGCSLQGSVLLNSGVAGARVTPAPALTSPHSHGPPGQGPSLSACPATQSTHKPSLPVLFVSHHCPSTVHSHNAWLWWKGPPDTQHRQPGGFQIHYPLPWQSKQKKDACFIYINIYFVSRICICRINQCKACTYFRIYCHIND